MADDRRPVLALFLIGVAVAAGALLEEIDEALYLFLSSQVAPPPACPEHEVFQPCSGNCSDCARRGACRADCAFQGCDCLHNFVRMDPGGPCQPVHLCPVPECGENEVFRACGAVCERCGGVRCRMLQCEHRCYCREGHLRDEQGRCVPEEQCPKRKRCFRDEEMGTRGRVDEYCLRDEATSNATETRGRCYCREGFSRDTVGHCVRDELCERVQCPGVEVYQSCPRKCNVTCRGDPGPCQEDGQCFPGCFCPRGHRVDDFRRCVPEHQCPPTGSTPSTPTPGPSTEPPSDSSTPLTSTTEVQVSSSSPLSADEEEEIVELPEEEEEYIVVVGSTTTPTPVTTDTDETTLATASTQGVTEIASSSSTQEKSTTTAAPPTTVHCTEMTRAVDDETTTFETTTSEKTRRDNFVDTTPTTTTSITTTHHDETTTFETTTSEETRRDDFVVTTTTTSITTTSPSEDEKNDF